MTWGRPRPTPPPRTVREPGLAGFLLFMSVAMLVGGAWFGYEGLRRGGLLGDEAEVSVGRFVVERVTHLGGDREAGFRATGHLVDSQEEIGIDVFAGKVRSLQPGDTITVYRLSDGSEVSYATDVDRNVDWTALIIGLFCLVFAVGAGIEGVKEARRPPPAAEGE